jgi:hypothetical protein
MVHSKCEMPSTMDLILAVMDCPAPIPLAHSLLPWHQDGHSWYIAKLKCLASWTQFKPSWSALHLAHRAAASLCGTAMCSWVCASGLRGWHMACSWCHAIHSMALVTGSMGLDMIHHNMVLVVIPVVPSQHIQVHPMTTSQVTMVCTKN